MKNAHREGTNIFYFYPGYIDIYRKKNKKKNTKAMKTEKLQVDTHALSLSHVSPSHPQTSLQYIEDTL